MTVPSAAIPESTFCQPALIPCGLRVIQSVCNRYQPFRNSQLENNDSRVENYLSGKQPKNLRKSLKIEVFRDNSRFWKTIPSSSITEG